MEKSMARLVANNISMHNPNNIDNIDKVILWCKNLPLTFVRQKQ